MAARGTAGGYPQGHVEARGEKHSGRVDADGRMRARRRRLARRLVELGALVQATADFFLREQMAAGMLALAEAGLVHVLSSDAHSSHGGRPAKLSAAFERLATVEPTASHLEWIRETAPRAIVEGAELDRPF